MSDWHEVSWECSALAAATEALARVAGLTPSSCLLPPLPDPLVGNQADALSRYLIEVGERLSLDLDHVSTTYAEIPAMLKSCAPALLRLQLDGSTRFLAVLASRGARLKVLAPSLQPVWLPLAEVLAVYLDPIEAPHRAAIEHLLEVSGVAPRRRQRARQALLSQRIAGQPVGACWILRLSPGRPFLSQLRHEGVLQKSRWLVLGFLCQHFVLILAWWSIGKGALQGVSDPGWLWAWALLLFCEIPLRLFGSHLQGLLFSAAGATLKKRLLYGTLRLDQEHIRLQGAGQLLSRVLESETIETIALAGGFQALLMAIELAVSFWVLSQSAAPVLLPVLLIAWIGLAALICRRHYRQQKNWSDQRLAMTHELIEKMVGHRTRLAQERRETWHQEEDLALRDYLRGSQEMDRSDTWMNAIVVRGWMVLAVLGLGVALLEGSLDRTGIAIGLGGILLARSGFLSLSLGFKELMTALIAWQRVAPLFQAAPIETTHQTSSSRAEPTSGPLLQAVNLGYHYPGRRNPVLAHCSLSIERGDKLLLEGSSGSGKSTLGAILCGQRGQDHGLLLLGGMDRESLGGRAWRKRVAAAPQFHENHVFTETFEFNLLMGRAWPPRAEDSELASQICHELGLGPLLERMPAGLQQMVGETGWQLSHGERSRLFIARTLLQGAELVVLDESFAALDPENLQRAMATVQKHAPTLLVIAHP